VADERLANQSNWRRLVPDVANLLAEFKRRNVIRAALAYLAAAWLIAQAVGARGTQSLGGRNRPSAHGSTRISVHDSGVGIFRKIAKALNLEDDRHAVLELSKGKVTTDPANHTGEGIFFSSRVFDLFRMLSGGVYFQHERGAEEDWILADEPLAEHGDGTAVYMTLNDDSKRTLRGVFDEYATDTVDYRFDRTVVRVLKPSVS
jgi:hypothetical protein